MYAEAHGWMIGACYMDGGFSGAKMDRPGLQQLIDDAKNHRINKVLVYKIDRLSRSQKDTLYLIEDVFLANKVDFVSMSETLDTSTPFGIAMVGILSVFAQLERETIKERMSIGKDASIRAGHYHGATRIPVFGYKSNNGKLVPDEYELSLVKRVFDLYLEGHTKRKIARIMEEESPARDTPWESIRVTRILSNPIYIGKQLWKGEVYDCDDVKPVLDMATWNAVQYRRDRLKTGIPTNQTPNNHKYSMLGGMIFCAKCGRRYCGITAQPHGKAYKYYRCSGTTAYKNAEGSCKSPVIPMEELDDMILAEISKVSADRSLIIPDKRKKSKTINRIEAMKKRLSEISSQQRRLIDLYALETIDKSILLERSNALNTERTKLENQINTACATIQKPTTFEEDLDTFEQLINHTTDKMELYQIVHSLIDAIIVDNGNISIKWSV